VFAFDRLAGTVVEHGQGCGGATGSGVAGGLVNAVSWNAVDEAVAVCGVREKRSDGKLPAHVITYLTLALCLFSDDDYAEVATKVTGSLDRWACWDASWRRCRLVGRCSG